MRVLHVISRMNAGGIETWLMHVMRHVDRGRFAMDFLVHTQEDSDYDEELTRLGGRLLRTRPPRADLSFPAFIRQVRQAMARYGPYDVVHAHDNLRYGYVLREAAKQGVPGRIYHSHNTTPPDRRLLVRPMLWQARRLMQRHATLGLACSREAAAARFGPAWESDARFRVLPYGIDLQPFAANHDRATVRRELGIPPEARVVAHIGRFVRQKNHDFLVDIAAETLRRRSDVWFVLVGAGVERNRIEQRIHGQGLSGRVHLAGTTNQVPRLLAAMDAFVLPSLWEGLGLVLVEAQAAGLPCLFSDVVPAEVDVNPALCHRLPLDAGAAAWSRQLEACLDEVQVDRSAALNKVRDSAYNIDTCMASLTQLYETAGRKPPR